MAIAHLRPCLEELFIINEEHADLDFIELYPTTVGSLADFQVLKGLTIDFDALLEFHLAIVIIFMVLQTYKDFNISFVGYCHNHFGISQLYIVHDQWMKS